MATGRRILTIDCDYLHPRFAAAYLVIDEPRETGGGGASAKAAFVDNNTAHSVPLLLQALEREGLKPDQVQYVIITHVHLDHAGGTSQLMKACPKATLLAHPRAAKHMIDPSRLVSSARQVYGDEAFERMYGKIEPVEASRVRSVEDDEEIAFGSSAFGAPLRFLHTRGHANHHFCILEPESRSIFTGDSFGLAYPDLQRSGLFIIPTTSPTDFDGPEALKTLDRILATGARQALLTHFGAVTDLEGASRQLRRHLEFSQALMLEAVAVPEADREAYCERKLRSYLDEAARRQGLRLTAADSELLKLDLELNAQGLAFAAQKTAEKAAGTPPAR